MPSPVSSLIGKAAVSVDRRIATRYDKLARNFLSAVALAAIIPWWT